MSSCDIETPSLPGLRQVKLGDHMYDVHGHVAVLIYSSRYGSQRFGPCSYCGKHASRCFSASVNRSYKVDELDEETEGWTYYNTPIVRYGHESCVRAEVERIIDAINAEEAALPAPGEV